MEAADRLADIVSRLEQREHRLQAVENAQAIQNLKARDAAYCDDNYNPDGIAALLTENAVWESQGLGRYEGREAIREFFRGASHLFRFAIHDSLNGQMEVQGDTARAQWYLCMPCPMAERNQAMWRAGIDTEAYVRVQGAWTFRSKRAAPLFHTPFEAGWARSCCGRQEPLCNNSSQMTKSHRSAQDIPSGVRTGHTSLRS